MSTNLQQKALLAYLTVRLPSQSKTDKRASAEVDISKHAAHGSAKVTKRLFSKQSFGPLQNAAQALRAQHYKLTLAWDDTGARILPVARSFEYEDEMQRLHSAFMSEARKFSECIEATLTDEALRLGELFRRDDYPSNPLSQCSAEWTWRPVPEGDFRECGWDDDVAERVARKAEMDAENGMVRSLSDAYSRIKEAVGKVSTKLADSDGIFRNSLIDNVAEVLDSCDSLNIFNDSGLSRTIAEARALLVSPDIIRRDKGVRSDVQSKAASVFADLQSLQL